MAKPHCSPTLINELERTAYGTGLEIRHRPERYEPGTVLPVEITGVFPAVTGRAELTVEKFLGGGFAGQVYRCRLTALELPDGSAIPGLATERCYAVKIIIPPSAFSRRFRNAIYWLAFQGPFSAQVNYAACRAGLLWQKLVRRAAQIQFGRETAVKDAYASFFDTNLNAYGEITEWIEGRMWHLETDPDLFKRRQWQTLELSETGSAEFVAKRRFMAGMVELMHQLGAPEFARQYEWWTMKSQPNVMKRTDLPDSDGPEGGLCAIDFRAGLALLPFLPMSPGDLKLILDGFRRRALVQFDRCNLQVMREYTAAHPATFGDLAPMLDELKLRDQAYRRSLPDLTHHGLRPLFDSSLQRDIIAGLVEGYLAADLCDEAFAEKLRRGGLRFALFHLLGAVPFLGRLIRKRWGNAAYRRHIFKLLTHPAYLKSALQARTAHELIGWHRNRRADEARVHYLAARPVRFLLERYTLGLLPVTLHRIIIRPRIIPERIAASYRFLRDFIRSAAFRETWFLNEVAEGEKAGMLTRAEHDHIVSIVKEPFIVKYLMCMGAHFATIPVTQVVSVLAGLGVAAHTLAVKGAGAWEEASLQFGLIVAAFQVMPISPGSICRGLFVVFMMIRDRNWRDYLVAAPLSFAKYIGYLAFPLQMTATYPHLARFMAGRWATGAVHIIPVFGEKGALLEHWVFDLFFNLPQLLGHHMKAVLTGWMLLGLAVITPLLFIVNSTRSWTALMILLIAVFLCPRVIFYPLLKSGKTQ